MWTWRIGRHLLVIAATALLGAFLTATMVRWAPGFEADAEQLDPRLSSESIAAKRLERARNRDIGRFYLRYLSNALHGDLGRSQTLGRPVRELLQTRFPVTAGLVGAGLALGWMLALTLAFACLLIRSAASDVFATIASGVLLCIPAAVLALALVFFRFPAWLAIALVVFPKVFTYTRNLLNRAYSMPHIVLARAKGLGSMRVLLWHVLPVNGGQIVALLGVSVSIAIGAAIPVEALCGVPGVGQLAWQAALGRDLPLLVALTAVVAVVTLSGNALSDIVNEAWKPRLA